jgi:hypothetical protein
VVVCSRFLLAHRPVSSTTRLGDPPVPVVDHLGEVVPGVNVHDRERDLCWREGTLGQGQHHDRVLAAGEQQHRPLELGGYLSHDVDRLSLENVELGHQVISAGWRHRVSSGSLDV